MEILQVAAPWITLFLAMVAITAIIEIRRPSPAPVRVRVSTCNPKE